MGYIKKRIIKKKHSSLDELREPTLDIWCKFPVELCKKIVGEFNSKIRICQQEEGKILNKALFKKYNKEKKQNYDKDYDCKEKKQNDNKDYDWTSIKREKCFRIVYNNKIIELLIKKVIKRIKCILKIQKNNYKKDFPKAEKGEKIL